VDNPRDSNSVIDLVFLPPDNRGFGQHMLYPNICKPSDHIPLVIEVGIMETDIDLSIRAIKKNSKEEKSFIISLTNSFSNINSSAIRTKKNLERLVQQMATIFKNAWNNHSKLKHIMKHSKEWWNQDCSTSLNRYQLSGDFCQGRGGAGAE